MTYERFSELWDALVTNRPNVNSPLKSNMTDETLYALIDYGKGNIDNIMLKWYDGTILFNLDKLYR